MDIYIQTLLTGLGDGAVIAGVALGLVLAYQGSGVVNFAHGAMMMYSTYIYDELRDTGDLVFPISISGTDRVNLLGTPASGDLTAFWPAFLIALGVAAILGLLVHLLVFRPLRGAPLLAKIVATVGVFIVLQSVVLLRFGTQNETVRAILPTDMVNIFGTRIPEDRLWLAAIVVIASLFLAAIYRFTLFGIATRAAAEEEKGATLIGFSPDMLAAGNWMLASMVAAVFGILAASLSNGVNTVNYTLLVVPALAGALVGSLRSFGVTAATCLALGMFRSELSLLQMKSWWPEFAGNGMRDVLPFFVIIVILFFRGDRLPSRASHITSRLAFAPAPRNILPGSINDFSNYRSVNRRSDRICRPSFFGASSICRSIRIHTGENRARDRYPIPDTGYSRSPRSSTTRITGWYTCAPHTWTSTGSGDNGIRGCNRDPSI